MFKQISYFIFGQLLIASSAYAELGFVDLPLSGESAYVACNGSGNYGRKPAVLPSPTDQNRCAVISDDLLKSPLSSPLSGFRLIGVQVGDVEMDKFKSGSDAAVARLSEAIWRNSENTECVLATQLEMRDAPLANGEYFEVNDIAHAGFAKKNVAIGYFHKAHSREEGGSTEVLFRAGRAFTSARTETNGEHLPSLKNAPPVNTPFSSNGAVAFSQNWIDFTTDVSFKDVDGVTRKHSSIFYIKYACDSRDPVSVSGAIRLRSMGANAQEQFELSIPGLIPADGSVDLF